MSSKSVSQAVLAAGSRQDSAKPRPNRRTAADARAEWSPSDRIISEPERAAITGFSRNWWWVMEQRGLVPKRIKLGAKRVGWLESELQTWLQERAAQRDGGGDARPAA